MDRTPGNPGGGLPGLVLSSHALGERGEEGDRERWKEDQGACKRGSLSVKNTNDTIQMLPYHPLTKSIQDPLTWEQSVAVPFPRGKSGLGSRMASPGEPGW